MITALDTNVLLDVLLPNPDYVDAVLALLEESRSRGPLIIGEVVYAELGAQFPSAPELERFLDQTGIRWVPSSPIALQRGSEAWKRYLRRRSAGQQCPACGAMQTVTCRQCGRVLGGRQHVMADFLIAGHAAVHAQRLLTRDRGFYRSCFPGLVVVGPKMK